MTYVVRVSASETGEVYASEGEETLGFAVLSLLFWVEDAVVARYKEEQGWEMFPDEIGEYRVLPAYERLESFFGGDDYPWDSYVIVDDETGAEGDLRYWMRSPQWERWTATQPRPGGCYVRSA